MTNIINYQKWFQAAKEQNFDALEFSIAGEEQFTIILEDNIINEHIKSSITTVTVIGLCQNKKVSLCLEKIDDSLIDSVLATLKTQIAILNFKEPDFVFDGTSSYPKVKEYNFDFSSVKIVNKYDLLFFLRDNLTKSSYLKTIDSIEYTEVKYFTQLLNSKGVKLIEQGSYAVINTYCVFHQKDDLQAVYEKIMVRDFDSFDINRYAQEIINLGEKKLGAQSIKSQNYPVVFANKIFAQLLKNFSSLFSGMNAYRQLTKLKGKEGQKIAASNVTLINDPFHPEAFFQYAFDGEGVPCQTKYILQKGIFKQFIHNLKTAHLFNTTSTGNGYSNSVSMNNFYLQKGTDTLAKMLMPIEEGVYIDYLIGTHAGINNINGDFSLQAAGFKISKGEITSPVKMIVVSGNFLELLQNIQNIANDFVFLPSGFGSASVYGGFLSIAGNY